MRPESETKCRLLKVAIELIAESSYGSVSVDDICRKADVKKGSFYHFFPSKSDLTVAAMEADWQKGRPGMDETFSPQTPPLERIAQYCESTVLCQNAKKEQYGKICGCPMITLGAELSTQDEKIRGKAVEIANRYITYLESAIRDARDAGLIETSDTKKTALELFSYFQGVLLQAKIRNDLAPLQGLKDGMFRLLQLDTVTA